MPRSDHANPYKRQSHKKRDYSERQQTPSYWAGWMRTYRNQVVRILSSKKEGEGPDVLLYWPPGPNGRNNLALNLSDLTEAELLALRGFLEGTFDLALPVCRLRDGNANERFTDGDDSDSRVYRQLPEVVERPWAIGINSESILERLAYVPPVDEPGGGAAEVFGGDEPGLVEPDEADVEPEDDYEAVDLFEGLGEVGGNE